MHRVGLGKLFSQQDLDQGYGCALLSYGHPWTHYPSGYQERLLGGPLGLLDLCYTTPVL
jgi:hypothetical protein